MIGREIRPGQAMKGAWADHSCRRKPGELDGHPRDTAIISGLADGFTPTAARPSTFPAPMGASHPPAPRASCKDGPVLVEYATHPQFLSNTYLVADGQGGPAFFIDAGGPVGQLIDKAERLELEPTHVLLTHHHFDHVSEVGALLERWPDLEVLISSRERELMGAGSGELREGAQTGPAAGMGMLEAGETLQFGALECHPLHTPGHTAGMLSFLIGER